MKFVPFQKFGKFDTRTFLLDMLRSAPAGQSIGQMRERLNPLNALEAAGPDGATLEDAEHVTLMGVINARQDFAITSADLIALVDSVAAAKAPSKADKAKSS